MRPRERSSLGTVSLTDHVQCMQMSSIKVGLDYDSTVMLTCKLLLVAAKAIVDVGPDTVCPDSHKLCLLDFFLQGLGGH